MTMTMTDVVLDLLNSLPNPEGKEEWAAGQAAKEDMLIALAFDDGKYHSFPEDYNFAGHVWEYRILYSD